MNNFTVNVVGKVGEDVLGRFYTCEMFDYHESGELKLYGFNGSCETVSIFINKSNYSKVFIMNGQGNTVFTKRVES